jgi:tetratricopeptide (TPR) repeat protein
MLWMRVAFCFPVAVAMLAQSDDIQQRVLQAVGAEADGQAEVLLREKRFVDVESMLSETHEGWAVKGALEFLGGRMEGAAKCFEAARRSGELREADSFTLAMAWVRLGQDDNARRELMQLAAKQPEKALYAYWLGRLDYDQRRYAAAVDKLKRATALDAKSARAWDSLGLAYDMQGQLENALQALEEGARTNREQAHASAWPPHDLGLLLLRTGATKRAVAAFREALQYDPQMEQAHYHLGRALEKDGANEEAIREYLTAMEEDQHAADVCYSLAMLYRKLSRKRDADAMFSEWRKRRDAQP